MRKSAEDEKSKQFEKTFTFLTATENQKNQKAKKQKLKTCFGCLSFGWLGYYCSDVATASVSGCTLQLSSASTSIWLLLSVISIGDCNVNAACFCWPSSTNLFGFWPAVNGKKWNKNGAANFKCSKSVAMKIFNLN